MEISYRRAVRTPLGRVTAYSAPAENTQPPRLLLGIGHPPELADAVQEFFSVLVQGALSARDRKIATLAVAAALANGYEWGHHAATANAVGIDERELAAIKIGEVSSLAPRDALIVSLALAVERSGVTDELWADVAAEFSVEEQVQLTVVASFYGMLARIQSALEVEQDEGFTALD